MRRYLTIPMAAAAIFMAAPVTTAQADSHKVIECPKGVVCEWQNQSGGGLTAGCPKGQKCVPGGPIHGRLPVRCPSGEVWNGKTCATPPQPTYGPPIKPELVHLFAFTQIGSIAFTPNTNAPVAFAWTPNYRRANHPIQDEKTGRPRYHAITRSYRICVYVGPSCDAPTDSKKWEHTIEDVYAQHYQFLDGLDHTLFQYETFNWEVTACTDLTAADGLVGNRCTTSDPSTFTWPLPAPPRHNMFLTRVHEVSPENPNRYPDLDFVWDDVAKDYLFCLFIASYDLDTCDNPVVTDTVIKGSNGYVTDWTGTTGTPFVHSVLTQYIATFEGQQLRYAIKSCNGRRQNATRCSNWVVSAPFGYSDF